MVKWNPFRTLGGPLLFCNLWFSVWTKKINELTRGIAMCKTLKKMYGLFFSNKTLNLHVIKLLNFFSLFFSTFKWSFFPIAKWWNDDGPFFRYYHQKSWRGKKSRGRGGRGREVRGEREVKSWKCEAKTRRLRPRRCYLISYVQFLEH